MSRHRKQRVRWIRWLGLESAMDRRGVRRPTEDLALGRIQRHEKRAARAARDRAWAKEQRPKDPRAQRASQEREREKPMA